MKYNFTITEEKFKQAKGVIRNNGGTIYSDNTFEISGVEGEFSFTGTNLCVNITDKPWPASWDMIEGKLNNFFN